MPQPEPPPSEPPLELWSSLVVLGIGAAILMFVLVKVLRESEPSSTANPSDAERDGDSPSEEAAGGSEGTTELSDGDAV